MEPWRDLPTASARGNLLCPRKAFGVPLETLDAEQLRSDRFVGIRKDAGELLSRAALYCGIVTLRPSSQEPMRYRALERSFDLGDRWILE
jgi:hypothetical protein